MQYEPCCPANHPNPKERQHGERSERISIEMQQFELSETYNGFEQNSKRNQPRQWQRRHRLQVRPPPEAIRDQRKPRLTTPAGATSTYLKYVARRKQLMARPTTQAEAMLACSLMNKYAKKSSTGGCVPLKINPSLWE